MAAGSIGFVGSSIFGGLSFGALSFFGFNVSNSFSSLGGLAHYLVKDPLLGLEVGALIGVACSLFYTIYKGASAGDRGSSRFLRSSTPVGVGALISEPKRSLARQ